MIDVLSILSTSQCCTITNQHRVYIGNMSLRLHRSHRRHYTAVRYRMNIMSTLYTFLLVYPMRIRVRIDPPLPLVCRKRRLNGAVLRMRPEKPRSRVTAGVAR
jgi:hypothetical protein